MESKVPSSPKLTCRSLAGQYRALPCVVCSSKKWPKILFLYQHPLSEIEPYLLEAMSSTSMKTDVHLSRSLTDSLLEVVQSCHNKLRLNKESKSASDDDSCHKSKAMLWFETLNKESLFDILVSHEQEWLIVICDMVTESRRTPKGDENLYALDEEFPQATNRKRTIKTFHRR